MYNWVTTRKVARTEGPNYPTRAFQTNDAVVAKWIPAFVGLLACAVTPVRASQIDSRYYTSPTYPVRAVQTNDALVAQQTPARVGLLACPVTPTRQKLDVRGYDWQPAFTWVQPVVDRTVATWAPAFGAEIASARTPARSQDTRDTQPSTAWIFTTLPVAGAPTTAQIWPAVQQPQGLGLTAARPGLDVRTWQPQLLNLPTFPPDLAQQVPAWLMRGERTADRPGRDVRWDAGSSDVSWIAATLTAGPTAAQSWPAILANLAAERTRDRARDPRWFQDPANGLGWLAGTRAAIAQQWPPVLEALSSGRTPERPRLDVRRFEWAPSVAGWIAQTLPVPPTTAQRWPALLQALSSGRTRDGRRLDVRYSDWVRVPFDYTTTPTTPTIGLGHRRGDNPTPGLAPGDGDRGQTLSAGTGARGATVTSGGMARGATVTGGTVRRNQTITPGSGERDGES